ncbi:SRPBCC family protein [Bacteroidota bacterium]
MRSTYQSITINTPVEKVWDRVKNFHDFSFAPSVITKCEPVVNKNASEIGAKRVLNDAIHETLIELNNETHTLRYSIDEGPTPVSSNDVKKYIGKLHLRPVTKDNTTFVEWSSSWDSDSEDAVEFCQGIYVALLDDLAKNVE